jgi:hypothetical protein
VQYFLTNGFFRSNNDYRFYRILGVATAAGAEVNAETPGVLSEGIFDKSDIKVSGWIDTFPLH